MMDKDLIKICQHNPWLKYGAMAAEGDPLAELEYEFIFYRCTSLEELLDFLLQGNWAIRQGFIFESLAFIQQVNGGDEWLTIKEFEDQEVPRLLAFESITAGAYPPGELESSIKSMLLASFEDCRTLNYK